MRRIPLGRQVALGFLGLFAFVTVAVAQPPEGRPKAAGPRTPPSGARAGDVREAVHQMVIARLKVALNLTEGQEKRVIPRVQQLMQARREHAEKRRAGLARLRALLLDETADDREIDRALRSVREIEDDYRCRELSLREAVDRELDPRQQALMVFFEARLRRVMERRIQETLGAGPGPVPRRGIGPPPARGPGQTLPRDGEEPDGPEASEDPEDDL